MYNNLEIGQKLEIHCYKHNGKLHRQWDEAVVLEINDEYIVFGNNKTIALGSAPNIVKKPTIKYLKKLHTILPNSTNPSIKYFI